MGNRFWELLYTQKDLPFEFPRMQVARLPKQPCVKFRFKNVSSAIIFPFADFVFTEISLSLCVCVCVPARQVTAELASKLSHWEPPWLLLVVEAPFQPLPSPLVLCWAKAEVCQACSHTSSMLLLAGQRFHGRCQFITGGGDTGANPYSVGGGFTGL